MPTLKEIKGRIGSVKSTLKITSAMKLVSSAKLRKAQQAVEAMRPYEATLQHMLAMVGGTACAPEASSAHRDVEMGAACAPEASSAHRDVEMGAACAPEASSAHRDVEMGTACAPEGPSAHGNVKMGAACAPEATSAHRPAAIIAIASNSSLCGGFNANAIAKVRSVRQPGDVVFSVGRKMADAMRRDGFTTPEDLNALIEHPAYAPAAALVERLAQDVEKGRYARVLLVYNHFVSTARQEPVVEELLGDTLGPTDLGMTKGVQNVSNASPVMPSEASASPVDVLIEPGRKELLESLLPKTLKLKLYAALLDSAAAEHAARTVAMQMATDNAENLLSELTLQYNKGRQQKITSEILDLAGGQNNE